MKNQTENQLAGVVSKKLPINGREFNIWFRDGDSYMAQESLNVRATESSAFRNTCVNLLGSIDTNNTTCVLDVGANVGITTLVLGMLAKDVKLSTPISRIVSFEPEPLTYECLAKNAQHFPDLITPVNCALGERSGSLPFMRTPGSTSASHIVTDEHFTGATNELVKVERLDYYVEKFALPHVGLIKIDVEGHEKAVLLGSIGTIEKFNTVGFYGI
jgi:FkbM family methyltransferase